MPLSPRRVIYPSLSHIVEPRREDFPNFREYAARQHAFSVAKARRISRGELPVRPVWSNIHGWETSDINEAWTAADDPVLRDLPGGVQNRVVIPIGGKRLYHVGPWPAIVRTGLKTGEELGTTNLGGTPHILSLTSDPDVARSLALHTKGMIRALNNPEYGDTVRTRFERYRQEIGPLSDYPVFLVGEDKALERLAATNPDHIGTRVFVGNEGARGWRLDPHDPLKEVRLLSEEVISPAGLITYRNEELPPISELLAKDKPRVENAQRRRDVLRQINYITERQERDKKEIQDSIEETEQLTEWDKRRVSQLRDQLRQQYPELQRLGAEYRSLLPA